MDELTKTQLKWKFYSLAIQLNIIILLVALAIISFFIVPDKYRIPVVVGMLIVALVLSIKFSRNYRLAKAWLEEHASEPDKPGRHADARASTDKAIEPDPKNVLSLNNKGDALKELPINPQNEAAFAEKIEMHPQIIYTVTGNVQAGDKTQTDIQNEGVIQRSTLGTEIPLEKKVCPRCHQKIHNEKFCPECGQDIR